MSAYVVALIEPDPDQVHCSHTEYGPTARGLLERCGATVAAAGFDVRGEPVSMAADHSNGRSGGWKREDGP